MITSRKNLTFLKASNNDSGKRSLLETGPKALFKTIAMLSLAIDTAAWFEYDLTSESVIALIQSRSFKVQPTA